MKCPFCGFDDTHVKDSRRLDDSNTIKRRRFCASCGARFTTHERIEIREIKVIKKNGQIRPFDSSKLYRSIEIAARKRHIKSEDIEQVVDNIFKKLDKHGDGEVKSSRIGELVMEELAALDEVSYVRYASVYRDFSKASDFGSFIAQIRKGA